METSRDNANVFEFPRKNAANRQRSQQSLLSGLIPENMSQSHLRGDIHIHDLTYGKTLNCVQIPLGRLLREGFNNGHGYIRPPKRPDHDLLRRNHFAVLAERYVWRSEFCLF